MTVSFFSRIRNGFPVVAGLQLALLLSCLGHGMSAAEQTISGDPLQITVRDDLSIKVMRHEGSVTDRQYFNTYGTYVVLTPISQTAPAPQRATLTPVTNILNTSAGPSTITTGVVAKVADDDDIQIAHQVTYVAGADTYKHEWVIHNNGQKYYSELSLRYGGDTYFHSDAASGFYDAELQQLYSTNPDFAGRMNLYADGQTPANYYYEGAYGAVNSSLADPANHLPNTTDPSFIDNGMGLEWVFSEISPDRTITITAYESWTSTGLVAVTAPVATSIVGQQPVTLHFTVQNQQDSDSTFSLSTSTDSSDIQAAVAPSVDIAAGASVQVDVQVTFGQPQVTTTDGPPTATASRQRAVTLQSYKVTLLATPASDTTRPNRAQATITVGPKPPTPVTIPTVTLSLRRETVFGAICPSTPEGVLSLRSALSGRSDTEAVCYAWDARTQTYALLPAEPTVDGLTSTTGAFLATRVDLGLDFNGTAATTTVALTLRPGWNFCGLPPIDDGETILVNHAFPGDFTLLDENGSTVTTRQQFADILGTVNSADPATAQPYLFDGHSYGHVASLTTGRGYWIKNNGASPVTLQRVIGGGQTLFDASQVAALRNAKAATTYRDRGTPPTPPTAAAASDDGGSCGHGGGIACLLGLGGLLALRRQGRPGC